MYTHLIAINTYSIQNYNNTFQVLFCTFCNKYLQLEFPFSYYFTRSRSTGHPLRRDEFDPSRGPRMPSPDQSA